MGYTRYGRKGLEAEDLSAQEIFERLEDWLLQSGFPAEWSSDDVSLDDLRQAVLRALASQSVIPLEDLERMLEEASDWRETEVGRLVERLVDRMIEEGYIRVPPQGTDTLRERPGDARFEISDKGLDFLGFRALRDTLSKAGRASFGGHDTRQLSTGVDAVEAPKPYEFGDTLNLDGPATVLEAVRRSGLASPISIDYPDLRVRQGERRVSAATVVMLDCSHSMILYGEDRFTPAKRVALALAHLVRTQFPGDELSLVLFHDSAEEVPLTKLPRVRVGPWHTNTAAGLEVARRILARTRREMRSIVMITDGKPSALTLPDGRIYRNSMGLDPVILRATFEQVAACRRSGIAIQTFMLARDRALVAFVRRVTEIARGKAYFTTPLTLGRYVALDFVRRKVETLN